MGIGVLAAPAQAGEDDRALSVSLSWARYALKDASADGAALGVDYERGFSDTMSFRASGGGGYYLGDAKSYSGHFTIGATYIFDVVKWVPYANIGIGGIYIGGGEDTGDDKLDTGLKGLLELGAGLDILHSRKFSYGVVMRFESFVETTAFFTMGVRATYRWGFF
jgi:hypothetical protein